MKLNAKNDPHSQGTVEIVKIKPPIEERPSKKEEYDQMFLECLVDHRKEMLPSDVYIIDTLNRQYAQKLVQMKEQALQKEAELEKIRVLQEEQAAELNEEIKEDERDEELLGKRGPSAPIEVEPKSVKPSQKMEEKAQLSQAYLLTKEKPNFIPRALLSRKKQEEEQALTEAIGRQVEVDMKEEEEVQAVLKAAQEKKKIAVDIPRPAFSLDDADDDEFVSGEE